MKMWLAMLLLACGDGDKGGGGAEGEGEGEGETGEGEGETGEAAFELCAWIAENTPSEIAEGEAVDVYCLQDGLDCSTAVPLVTTQATIDEGAELCRLGEDQPIFELFFAYCPDPEDDSVRYNAVACHAPREPGARAQAPSVQPVRITQR